MKDCIHRRRSFFFLALILCGIAFLCCSCAFRQDLVLDEKDSGRTLRLNSGDTVTITLNTNPTTGYLWKFASPPFDENVVILRGDRYINPSEALAGSSGKRALTFVAERTGKTGVRLVYVRPWEKKGVPEREFNVMMIVKDGTEEEGGVYSSTSRRNYKGEESPRLRRSLFRKK